MRGRDAKMVTSNCSSESLNVRIESAANRVAWHRFPCR